MEVNRNCKRKEAEHSSGYSPTSSAHSPRRRSCSWVSWAWRRPRRQGGGRPCWAAISPTLAATRLGRWEQGGGLHPWSLPSPSDETTTTNPPKLQTTSTSKKVEDQREDHVDPSRDQSRSNSSSLYPSRDLLYQPQLVQEAILLPSRTLIMYSR